MPQKNDPQREQQHGLVVEEARPEVQRPPLYQVVLLNDDFTPMDFVVVVLETFFNMDRERATQVMLHVHTRGKGVCGVFTREVAETKVTQVNEFARAHQHPCEPRPQALTQPLVVARRGGPQQRALHRPRFGRAAQGCGGPRPRGAASRGRVEPVEHGGAEGEQRQNVEKLLHADLLECRSL